MNEQLVKSLIVTLQDIADVLYQGHTQVGIANMNNIIPDLAIVASELSEDMQLKLTNDVLAPLLEAMETADATLIADIITFELIEVLNDII